LSFSFLNSTSILIALITMPLQYSFKFFSAESTQKKNLTAGSHVWRTKLSCWSGLGRYFA